MFTADNVLGIGTAVFSDLDLYIDSLERMKSACIERSLEIVDEKPTRLYTGHGPLIDDGKRQAGAKDPYLIIDI